MEQPVPHVGCSKLLPLIFQIVNLGAKALRPVVQDRIPVGVILEFIGPIYALDVLQVQLEILDPLIIGFPAGLRPDWCLLAGPDALSL
jgi:hypothetical protein